LSEHSGGFFRKGTSASVAARGCHCITRVAKAMLPGPRSANGLLCITPRLQVTNYPQVSVPLNARCGDAKLAGQ
jgi:hypothetical protein